MKKIYWKTRARTAEARIDCLEAEVEVCTDRVAQLRKDVAELTRDLEDKRKNWAPIKMKHPYVARDAKCVYCDDPAEDERHG